MALVPSLSAYQAAAADSPREKTLFNNGWTFALSTAQDIAADYGHGTEYFTYFTKARANGDSKAPDQMSFDDSSWQKVNLPHDWVVDLPYAGEASHSHGYKCVGYKYPENSLGWYRKVFDIPESDRGKRICVEFEGIFRDAEVFCNGIYMGHERSGYAPQVYDITEYLEYGGKNLITVRVDASMEEGWFYEGAGIYRNVWLHKTDPVSVAPFGVAVKEYRFSDDYSRCVLVSGVTLSALSPTNDVMIAQTLLDAEGKSVATVFCKPEDSPELEVANPILWSDSAPYLYTLRTCVYQGGYTIDCLRDEVDVKVGLRDLRFDPDRGFIINGRRVEMKGCDLHQDHAGVGSAIPDALWRYRVEQLKKYGFNTIRSSHNPATPAMLQACDELGMYVIDENRCVGINEEHFTLMEKMIRRDVNHPSVVLWSIGNEEWQLEWSAVGEAIARRMTAFVHSIDPSRQVTYGNCSGRDMVKGVDVFGYNYVVQNPILEYHKSYPDHCALGTEETSGCGTRGKYVTDNEKGWMLSHNRAGVAPDEINGSDEGCQTTPDGKILNVIERGWKFYAANTWLAGPCYWTGFDYRGEPNPMVWPATGSQFGILDYCGFPKDEAFYLKSCWTDEPMVYLCPSWNRTGSEGKYIDVWAYSNCDEVQLLLNGVPLGKKAMPKYGHLSWNVKYKAGKLEARGFIKGRKVASYVLQTTGAAKSLKVEASKTVLLPDGQDVTVLDLTVLDEKGREVPDADVPLSVSVPDNFQLLGWGNGDPGFKLVERPLPTDKGAFAVKTFSGKVQIIIRSVEGADGEGKILVAGLDCAPISLSY